MYIVVLLYISSDLRALIPSLWIAQISLAELHAALASAGQLSRCSDGGTTRIMVYFRIFENIRKYQICPDPVNFFETFGHTKNEGIS